MTHMALFPGISIARLRVSLCARERIGIPRAGPGTLLRGAFGTELKRLVCAFDPGRTPCAPCELRSDCLYPRTFELHAERDSDAPRRTLDPPRPFVIDPPDLGPERREVSPGEFLDFSMVLMGPRSEAVLPFLVTVWERLATEGIGAPRGRFILKALEALDPADPRSEPCQVYDRDRRRVDATAARVVDSAEIEGRALSWAGVRAFRVRFLTPTDLRSRGEAVRRPDFHHVFRRLLTRLSGLAQFHGAGRPTLDFRGLVGRAEAVRTESAAFRWIERDRLSGHAPVRHDLSGVVGDAVYSGNLDGMLGPLALGEVVHVGKDCVFGNGRIAVEPVS